MKKEKNLPAGRQVSVEPYKGVRDFYPEDLAIQKFIFKAMRSVAESFGYEEYDASILEPTELYKAKSGEEIINEQTYSFEDRGGRNVTLRPEMTPSLARMVARKRRELVLPLRWYSLPNLFRYERPQRGRVREHWQFNADIFGVESLEAELEIISLAYQIMKKLRAKDDDFTIKINYAGMLARVICLAIDEKDEEKINKTIKIIDRFGKIPEEEFNKRLDNVLGSEKADVLKEKLNNGEMTKIAEKDAAMKICKELENKLNEIGIMNVKMDTLLTRGFDYYTGIVFELFDIDPKNNRSLFGGGRYDDLLDIFGAEKIPAVGFGMGDVTTRDFLETRNLLPRYKPATKLYISLINTEYIKLADDLTRYLRGQNINIAIDYNCGINFNKVIKKVDRKFIPFFMLVGENEAKSKKFQIRNMETGDIESELTKEEIVNFLKTKTNEKKSDN